MIMSEWKKVKIGDVCRIEKGSTGIASAEPGQYPLVVTAAERKTCSSFQFDCSAVCIPLVSSTGHGKKSLNYIHYQEGKFALGTILAAVIPNDENELSAKYLHQYLQFYKDTTLVPLMKGAANVSLAVRDIAKVEIPLPTIEKQREFAELFVTLQKKDKEIQKEFSEQKSYTKQLRQSVLQDAIEGKLTADWRKSHPVEKGNPDYDAEALFQKIQEEKEKQATGKKKSSEKLAEISDEENPFQIPTGWKWVRLGEIISLLSGQDFPPEKYNDKNNGIPYITGASNIVDTCVLINRWTEYPTVIAYKNDILLVCKGSGYGKCVLADFEKAHIARQIMAIRIIEDTLRIIVIYFLLSQISYLKSKGNGLIPGLDRNTILSMKFPLPPLAEQTEIVRRVETQLDKITQLEQQIATREELTKQLMRGILKDAFEGSK